MQVKDILLEKGAEVVTIGANRTIHDAIAKLNQYSIGALVVTGEQGEIAGIITERDVLRMCGRRCDHLADPPGEQHSSCPHLVHEAMTRDLVIGVPEDNLNYVMGIMTKNHIRHLPILDNGKLAGMISIGDLIDAHLEERIFENRTLREYLHGQSR